jgi:hypothetical protein
MFAMFVNDALLISLISDHRATHKLQETSIHACAATRKQALNLAIMAEESGVTEEGLKATLIEKLQATHVEIEDMSGWSLRPTSSLCPSSLSLSIILDYWTRLTSPRRLWPSL